MITCTYVQYCTETIRALSLYIIIIVIVNRIDIQLLEYANVALNYAKNITYFTNNRNIANY